MQKHTILQWLRLFSLNAPLVSAVAAVLMAGAAIYTALVVKHTADIATGEFALARKPVVFLTDLEPTFKMHSNGSGARLTLVGILREVRGVLTTVHEVRVGHYFEYEATDEARWRTSDWRDIPLYGDQLTRPMVLGSIELDKEIVKHIQKQQKSSSEVDAHFFVFFKVEYRLSIQGGEQEKWHVRVSVRCASDGTCNAREPPMPEIEAV